MTESAYSSLHIALSNAHNLITDGKDTSEWYFVIVY